ncbi:MAG: ABC transporter substrate-binding protein [Hyphomicrobiales bacterium]|nr:ABC transporter substrate-binding protein [Hyphomicrobiales bacterium]
MKALAGAAVLLTIAAGPSLASDTIRLAAQKTGTLSWEMDVIKHHGLDKQFRIDLQIVPVATPGAQKVALKGGSADIIVSDWTWVARQRALGDRLVFYPFSSTLGAVMVPASSKMTSLKDLKGKKLGIAGGPLDKSWLLLQALALRSGFDLKNSITPVFGAPPLLAAKARQGEIDAMLNYWHFCAALEASGFRRLIGMDQVQRRLGAKGPVAIIGYVFDGDWARKNHAAVDRFLAMTKKAKSILGDSDAEWQRIAKLTRARGPKALTVLRDRYREGIPRRSVDDEAHDAAALFRELARQGGTKLMEPAKTLEAAAFYTPQSGS